MLNINRDFNLLHPKLRPIVSGLAKDLIRSYEAGETHSRFELFEGYRSPLRQDSLRAKGATKASAFQSAHNFGLAVDFAATNGSHPASYRSYDVKPEHSWSWSELHDWQFLKMKYEHHGLICDIPWDRVHAEHPLWRQFGWMVK